MTVGGARYPASMNPAFAADGFAILPDLLTHDELARVDAALTGRARVGDRELLRESWCAELARRVQADARVTALLPHDHVPVQCTSFEKSAVRNWLVALHQDVAIPVAGRVDDPLLAGWSHKDGTWFVQPPDALLAQLVAVRVHVDECGLDDGPLHVVPGSHRHGRLSDADALALRAARGTIACPVPRGGAMVMRPLLLHASSKARGVSRRRVLHVVFGPAQLPHGLAWAREPAR